mmetsp:Transcript_5584/g.12719  ORF Transcript_5584/g.12719 Transcript_5584/m.12719 type:complete len:80 (+) Transcript_5584:135-374(+)
MIALTMLAYNNFNFICSHEHLHVFRQCHDVHVPFGIGHMMQTMSDRTAVIPSCTIMCGGDIAPSCTMICVGAIAHDDVW